MGTDKQRLAQYCASGRKQVHSWLNPVDAEMFLQILLLQDSWGIRAAPRRSAAARMPTLDHIAKNPRAAPLYRRRSQSCLELRRRASIRLTTLDGSR